MNVIEIKDLHFAYNKDNSKVPIFQSLNLSIQKGDFVVVKGQSGSGKSTLLYLIAGLLKLQKGHIILNGNFIHQIDDLNLSILRNRHLGFVFQQFHLLPQLTALENILLPTFYPIETNRSFHSDRFLKQLVGWLSIEDRLSHKPHKLSGGQQQRVAIARALINDPNIILADEPTGNLDSTFTQQILKILTTLNSQGKTVILVTHEKNIAGSNIFTIQDGQLVPEKENKKKITSIQKTPEKNDYLKVSWFAQMAKIFPLSLANAFQNKIRSLLTMLGVVVGVASVCSVMTLGHFTKEKALDGYNDLGANTLSFNGYPNWDFKVINQVPAYFQFFDWKTELLYLKTIFSDISLISPYMIDFDLTAIFAGQSIENEATLIGLSEDGLDILKRNLIAGVGINVHHVKRKHSVCVIGFEVGKRLFPNISPIGKMLYLSKRDYNTFACQVIGLLENKTSHVPGSNYNLSVYIPFTVFQMFSDRYNSQIHRAIIQTTDSSDTKSVGLAIQNFFKTKYGNSGVFQIDADNIVLSQMKKTLSLFSILLAAIALIPLLIGGIGIANLMLATVSEKVKEIGIRKSVGATNLSIRNQFLLESMILCVVAGIIGIVLGICIYQSIIYAVSQFISNVKFEWTFDLIALSLSFVSILVVGVLSGLIPAMKAEKLQVIDALNKE